MTWPCRERVTDGVADRLAGLRRDLVDVDRRLAVEHQRDRIGTAEHGGRGRNGERKGQPHRFTLAAHLDDDRRCRIGRQRGLVSCVSRAGMVAAVRRVREAACAPRSLQARPGSGTTWQVSRYWRFRLWPASERFGSAGFCGDGCAFSASATTGAGGVGLAGVGFPARSQRHDVDDVIVVLAERAYVDLADEFEAQGDILMPALRLDARDGRRQHGLHVGKIELDRRLERERDLIVAALGRNVDQLRQARTCSA